MAGLGIARLRITWLAVLLAGPVAAPAGSATALAGPATALAGPATALAEPAALGAPDPFLGEWVLDRSRSHYETELPMRMVIVMTATAQGVHYRSESTSPSGRVSASEYTADYDGQLAMVTSDVGMMAPVMLLPVTKLPARLGTSLL